MYTQAAIFSAPVFHPDLLLIMYHHPTLPTFFHPHRFTQLVKAEQGMPVVPSTAQSSATPATAAGVESAATEDDDFHDAVEEATETPTRGDTDSDHSDWGDADWEQAGGGDGAGAEAEAEVSLS